MILFLLQKKEDNFRTDATLKITFPKRNAKKFIGENMLIIIWLHIITQQKHGSFFVLLVFRACV